jgi:hypothetical protein
VSEKIKAWVIVQPNRKPIEWGCAFFVRTEAIHEACRGLLSWRDYDELGNDTARWKSLRKEGYRIVRATVEIANAK